jgi:hypothetical protein
VAQGLLAELQEGRPAILPDGGAATAEALHRQQKAALDAARSAEFALDRAVGDAGGCASLWAWLWVVCKSWQSRSSGRQVMLARTACVLQRQVLLAASVRAS